MSATAAELARTRPAVLLGITGGIACGKSEVGRILRRRGVAVRDADDIAHEMMRPGRPVYRAVVRRFGRGIVGRQGAIDRRRLGERVFAEPVERAALNALVHPAVARERTRWKRAARRRGGVHAMIIPLLFEVGATEDWSAVICVAAPRAEVFRRLEERGLGPSQARQRLGALMPLSEKKRRADYVIENDGTLQELERKTCAVLANVLRKERMKS